MLELKFGHNSDFVFYVGIKRERERERERERKQKHIEINTIQPGGPHPQWKALEQLHLYCL
jgi:hypothetical protein